MTKLISATLNHSYLHQRIRSISHCQIAGFWMSGWFFLRIFMLFPFQTLNYRCSRQGLGLILGQNNESRLELLQAIVLWYLLLDKAHMCLLCICPQAIACLRHVHRFLQCIIHVIKLSIFGWQIKRFLLLLTVKDTAMDLPSNLEARRRISFFATSLYMDIPCAPKVRNMLSFRYKYFSCAPIWYNSCFKLWFERICLYR